MTDIIERLRIESRREPHEPIWRGAIDEIEALRDLCGMAYQLAGAHDAPEEWLDALSNAAAGRPFSTDGLLPYIPQASD